MTTEDQQEDQQGHRRRLREKFLKSGLNGFHDYEKLELLLTYAQARRDVKPAAKRLLDKFGGIGALLDATPEQIGAVEGVAVQSALLLKLVRALCCEYLGEKMAGRDVLASPAEVYNFARMKMAARPDEAFMVLYLNTKNHVIAYEIVNEGTVDHAAVYPRTVIRKALEKNAAALIVVHNHPSGVCDPSASDLELTRTLKEAMKAMNIRLLDHVIVGKSGHFSLVEEGLL